VAGLRPLKPFRQIPDAPESRRSFGKGARRMLADVNGESWWISARPFLGATAGNAKFRQRLGAGIAGTALLRRNGAASGSLSVRCRRILVGQEPSEAPTFTLELRYVDHAKGLAVTRSASEAFLKTLADQTFLKLWTIPNTFYKPGKELADIVVPFGDDIVIISDKASHFNVNISIEVAWPRWWRSAVEKSLKQLAGAMRTVSQQRASIFTDAEASVPTPVLPGPTGSKRLHLVSIARPDQDPLVVPAQWDLAYVDRNTSKPFEIGKIEINGVIVHVFDGPTINLLLETLDTAPDFIAYLTGREAALRKAGTYEFVERDLLAAALIGWDHDPLGRPSVPPLETVVPGIWDDYVSSNHAVRRREADRPSRIIDEYINQRYEEFSAGRFLYASPQFEQHEKAMRLLAAESRFARRMIAHELYDILNEEDKTTFWATTVPSPTVPHLRYVWLIYPKRPTEMSIEQCDKFLMQHLRDHVLVAQARFKQSLVMGICLPNRIADDTAIFTILHEKVVWTEADQQQALRLGEDGIFANLEALHRVHLR
jgi:hypothetical protein